jgi:hypothetical protein
MITIRSTWLIRKSAPEKFKLYNSPPNAVGSVITESRGGILVAYDIGNIIWRVSAADIK